MVKLTTLLALETDGSGTIATRSLSLVKRRSRLVRLWRIQDTLHEQLIHIRDLNLLTIILDR
jgi:hypothetical protein